MGAVFHESILTSSNKLDAFSQKVGYYLHLAYHYFKCEISISGYLDNFKFSIFPSVEAARIKTSMLLYCQIPLRQLFLFCEAGDHKCAILCV